jgi:MoaA/NifB/PqqE/SkfB family radical SAM enzyme
MGTEDWLEVLFQAAEVGCKQVQFIGGEPTLHPDLCRMISFASAQGYSFIEVFTNATIPNENLLKTFVEHNVHIAISFYSDNPQTHDSITKHKGSFDRTVDGIKRFISAGLNIRAGIIEMPRGAEEAFQAKQFLEHLGISDIRIDHQRGIGRGAQKIHSLEPMSELCGECWKGKLCVTSTGKAYPCVFSRFADLGTAKKGIYNILKANDLLKFRARLKDYQNRKVKPDNLYAEILKDSTREIIMCTPLKCEPTCAPPTFCSPKSDVNRCLPTSTECAPAYSCDPNCNPGRTPCSPDQICNPDIQRCNPHHSLTI